MKHHYVPQFLLREWAETTPDREVETFRLDLPGLPSSRHAPRYVGYEPNLYALTLPKVAGMEQQAVEKHLLRHIDTAAASVLQKLTHAGFASLTSNDRNDWIRFIMSLRVRQPSIVTQLRVEASEHLEASLRRMPEEYQTIAGESDPPSLLEWTRLNFPGLVENIGMSFFHTVVDDEKIGNKIHQMKWWLWDFSKEKNELLLSDDPCIFTKGIDDPDLVIALPIGPNKAFMATKTERVANLMRKQRPNNLLVRLNESSLNQARVRIFARDASPRRFIENRLRKFPRPQ